MQRPLLLKIVVAALVASATLFAVGAALEHNAESNEKSTPTVRAPAEPEHAERPGESGEAGHRETASERRSENRSERILGINPDALPLVILAVAVSLALAAALWFGGPVPALLAAIFVVGLGAAALDVREAVHQADHSRPGIMTIAILVALLHLTASGGAAGTWRLAADRGAER